MSTGNSYLSLKSKAGLRIVCVWGSCAEVLSDGTFFNARLHVQKSDAESVLTGRIMYSFPPTFGAKNMDKKLELSKIQLFFQHFWQKNWKKVGRFHMTTFLPTFWQKKLEESRTVPYNRESTPLPESKWLPHIHETAPDHYQIILNISLRPCGLLTRRSPGKP